MSSAGRDQENVSDWRGVVREIDMRYRRWVQGKYIVKALYVYAMYYSTLAIHMKLRLVAVNE